MSRLFWHVKQSLLRLVYKKYFRFCRLFFVNFITFCPSVCRCLFVLKLSCSWWLFLIHSIWHYTLTFKTFFFHSLLLDFYACIHLTSFQWIPRIMARSNDFAHIYKKKLFLFMTSKRPFDLINNFAIAFESFILLQNHLKIFKRK